jgi:hypothetical protein
MLKLGLLIRLEPDPLSPNTHDAGARKPGDKKTLLPLDQFTILTTTVRQENIKSHLKPMVSSGTWRSKNTGPDIA